MSGPSISWKSQTALSARALSVGYGATPVVHGISLEVACGDLIALSGPNGSGKSTLLKTWLGIIPALSGDLSVLGTVPRSRGFRNTLMRIGYVAQSRGSGALPVTVREAVAMGRYGIAGFARRLSDRDWRYVDDAIGFVGLSSETARRMDELSGGQAQRVAIARAVAMDPQILILDEPMTHLDRENREELMELIGNLHRRREIAVVIVSHAEEVIAACSAIYRFGQGLIQRVPSFEVADA
jgi:ABC-type Mn2+/Zn2+ transport system ATPase subunit